MSEALNDLRSVYRRLWTHIQATDAGAETYLELGRAIKALVASNGHSPKTPTINEGVTRRAAYFVNWYRWEAYPKYRTNKRGEPVAYTPTRRIEGEDLRSAESLALGYDDATMRQIAEVWLQLGDDQITLGSRQQRTVSMMLTMAPAIAEQLGDG